MTLRVCTQPGCPQLIPAGTGRCPTHTTARPSAHRRGYDRAHRDLRATWQARINAGKHVTCWRCGERIHPGEPMDLGHDDNDRTITRGPEHANRCNRSAAGRKGATSTNDHL